ncbi:MAG: hypothetical protein WDW38_000993 [Sanguina aurantia]
MAMAMGMLDPHYFLGRAEILGWINDTLSLRLQKVEDTHNGAVACQLLDVLHAGAVPLKKVDFNAKNEYDMISNYKILQDVFTKLKVDKYIEVTKLTKGRPLDNMEFMQWFKAYWDQVTNCQPPSEYDGPSRRAQCKTGDVKGGMGAAAGPGRSISQGSRAAAPSAAAAASAPAPTRKAPAAAAAAPAAQRTSSTGIDSIEVGGGGGEVQGASLSGGAKPSMSMTRQTVVTDCSMI